VDEYWFAMLLCDIMDPVGALKIVLGFNLGKKCKEEMGEIALTATHLLSTHPRNIKGGAN